MLSCCVEVHPGYGAVPCEGDFVEQGDVLGLSVDSQDVVRAPMCGTVRLVSVPDGCGRRVHVQIWQDGAWPPAGFDPGSRLSSPL